MHKVSIRFYFFVMALTIFWLFVPLWIVSRFTGPLGALGIVICLVSVCFLMPKANAWLVVHTPFGRVWDWARR